MAHPYLLLMGLLIALFSSSVPMSLEMAALKRLPHKTFGILVSMEPAIVAIIAFITLSEHLTFTQVIAIVFLHHRRRAMTRHRRLYGGKMLPGAAFRGGRRCVRNRRQHAWHDCPLFTAGKQKLESIK
ncbi:EamA family transporter [Sodalis glossinidius]|uniref:EamA family transporter n=1 Tax=Sodalis glossinidius TaxID=63612 RepID=UPI000325EF6A|nr:EamA family transporter [Sodalis glossinidius]